LSLLRRRFLFLLLFRCRCNLLILFCFFLFLLFRLLDFLLDFFRCHFRLLFCFLLNLRIRFLPRPKGFRLRLSFFRRCFLCCSCFIIPVWFFGVVLCRCLSSAFVSCFTAASLCPVACFETNACDAGPRLFSITVQKHKNTLSCLTKAQVTSYTRNSHGIRTKCHRTKCHNIR